ncbi:hypothetical protein ACTXT7_000121 [Hymenolepis weldensis]
MKEVNKGLSNKEEFRSTKIANVILQEILILFSNLLKGDGAPISAKSLTESFGWTSDEMQIHQDIQELNRLLFEELEDNLKDTIEKDLINDLYKGCLKTTIQCLSCGKISERNDEFQDVNLSVSDCNSIEVALGNHTQVETLAGDNQYFCEVCKGRVDAIKKSKFTGLPPILTLSLSRFYFNPKSMEAGKLDKMCSFPLNLDMTAYLETEQTEPVNYDLFSIVIHVGTSACDGHYHAYIKEPYGYVSTDTKDQTTEKDSFAEQAQTNTNYVHANINEQWKPSSVPTTPQMRTQSHQYQGGGNSYDLTSHPIGHLSRNLRRSSESITNLKTDGRSTSALNKHSGMKGNQNHSEEVLSVESASSSRKISRDCISPIDSEVDEVKERVKTNRRGDRLRSNESKKPQSFSFDLVETRCPRLFRQTSTLTNSSISDCDIISSNTLNEEDQSTNHTPILKSEDSFGIKEDLNNAMDFENPENVKDHNGEIGIKRDVEKTIVYGKWFDFNDDVVTEISCDDFKNVFQGHECAYMLYTSGITSTSDTDSTVDLPVISNKLDPLDKIGKDIGEEESIEDAEDAITKHKHHNPCLRFLIDNWFTLATIAGVGLGFGVAFAIRATQPGEVALTWISIASMDLKKEGKIGLIGITYIILIDLISACLGAGFALLIQPEVDAATNTTFGNSFKSGTNMIDASPWLKIAACFTLPSIIMTEWISMTNKVTEIYSVLFCSIVFGAAARVSGKIARVFIDFFHALSIIVTKIMTPLLLLTPAAVVFMVASSISSRENIESEFVQLGLFVATVLVALAIHFLILIIVFFLASRKNPLRLLKHSTQAFFLAFATTSPALALPEIYDGLDKYGVRQPVSRLIGPLTATLKGDGPAAFIAAAAIFVAQNQRIDLNVGQIFTIIVLTFISSLGVPSVPSASIVLVVTVLSAIGVPTEGAAFLFAMEWLLDRCRSGSGALAMMFIPAATEVIADSLDRKKKLEEELESASDFSDEISPV